ncbi:AraC family transcriptional regulator [Sphingobacterium sp. CZ-UAM]|uniref:helix-turn-helix domain-containing protein n=1 Tax=Sphingobacterium sp. CZ-UAM TaxID=1933868 RepID=UPI0009849E92|nr:AraC family transcriptional regulator [Sphingobacterium sp. CZ-UAM]OOG17921.1 AraC family transcriptional regulator [Sphingobacterium sp. CZ-UAM]
MYTEDNITRSKEICKNYLIFLDNHIDDVIAGRKMEFLEINEIASELAISHTHLTDVVKLEMGNHPCYFYDLKIIDRAKEMLVHSQLPIAKIAAALTYDPSNFSKFFKKWTGVTPGHFRQNFLES